MRSLLLFFAVMIFFPLGAIQTDKEYSSAELEDRAAFLSSGLTEHVKIFYIPYENNPYIVDPEVTDLLAENTDTSSEDMIAYLQSQGKLLITDKPKTICYILKDEYQNGYIESLASPYITEELLQHYLEVSAIRKADGVYYQTEGANPYLCSNDPFPETKYELVANNSEYAVFEREVYSYQLFYQSGGDCTLSPYDIDKETDSYKIRLILQYDEGKGDWFICYHESIALPYGDEFQLVADRGDSILAEIQTSPGTSDRNYLYVVVLCLTGSFVLFFVTKKKGIPR